MRVEGPVAGALGIAPKCSHPLRGPDNHNFAEKPASPGSRARTGAVGARRARAQRSARAASAHARTMSPAGSIERIAATLRPACQTSRFSRGS